MNNFIKKNSKVFSILFSFLTVTAIYMDMRITSIKEIKQYLGTTEKPHKLFIFLWDLSISLATSYTAESVIIFVLIACFYYKIMKHNFDKSKVSYFLSFLFAFFQVFGTSFKKAGNWDLIFETNRNILKALIMFLGYAILFYMIIQSLILLTQKYSPSVSVADKKITSWFTDNKKSFFIVTGLILLMWLPYFIASFPALTNWDFFDMLDSYYGNNTNSIRVVNLIDENVTLNNNNPVLQTLMAVFVMKIGNFLGSPYIGLFIFVSIQAILFAMVLSYVLYFMAKHNINKKVRIALLLLYGLLPLNPNFAFTTLKDTNFAFVTILYILLIVELVTDTSNFCKSKLKLSLLTLTAFTMIMLRNNGLYVLLISSIIFIVALRKNWKKLILPLFLPIILFLFITNVVYPFFKIAPGSRAEAYSIFFQQTGRLLKEHGNDIPNEDKKTIEKIFSIECDELASRYSPEISDPIKSRFDKTSSSDDFKEYLSVWFKYLLKYPGTYIQATMNNYYGYFFPEARNWMVYTSIAIPGKKYNVQSPEKLSLIRTEMTQVTYLIRNFPVISMLLSIGFYTWCLFILILLSIYFKKKKLILILTPILILLLTSIAGPVNTLARYVYPMILIVPIYVIIILKYISNNETERKNESSCYDTCL